MCANAGVGFEKGCNTIVVVPRRLGPSCELSLVIITAVLVVARASETVGV